MLKASPLRVRERAAASRAAGRIGARRSAGDRDFRRAPAPRLRQPQAACARNRRLVPTAAAFRCIRCIRRMYADYECGRAGAPPVNVAATDRAAAHRGHGRDQARHRSGGADSVSLSGAAHRRERRGVRRAQVRSGHDFDRASARVRQAAGRAHPAGEYSQRTVHAGQTGGVHPGQRTSTTWACASTSAMRTS